MDRGNRTEWVFEGEKTKNKTKTKPLVFKVAILCVWFRAGWWWWWCVCWWVCGCVLMMFVCRSLGVGRVYWDGVGMCLGCVVEWVLDKWFGLYANTHLKYEYSVLNSIWPQSELSEFWKNTLQLPVFSFPDLPLIFPDKIDEPQ